MDRYTSGVALVSVLGRTCQMSMLRTAALGDKALDLATQQTATPRWLRGSTSRQFRHQPNGRVERDSPKRWVHGQPVG